MALYDYECGACGVVELARPIGTAPPSIACPSCGAEAARRFAAPALTAPSGLRRRAQEAADRSAHEPTVVKHLPPRPAGPRSRDPRHARLPRP
ncbi:FmdB family zinc ribbon protein [Conexibacter arvalis]|uniref:Putative FmdB family regulatory protein n=1 Tax=Conexibacter arvalis TaxID=912552 RepID=A0A840IC34_9ACTN|nr:FmdB family zinc ribbon protein [Conexibacter arvalis]MBB4661801.1 putative FmdB family regulatory protein [Conexibacter arvalis]